MREFDEASLTEAVIRRFGETPDPRLRQVMQALVGHLHAFVRDIEPSFEEWQTAIDFLTRTGQKCDDRRQEFILLSDTLGVSMLVDAINHRVAAGATPTTVLGPFYVENPPVLPLGTELAARAPGDRLHVSGRIAAAGGGPLPGAIVDVWQSDAEGFYDVQRPVGEAPELRARFEADAEGRFHFWTVVPSAYPVPTDGPVGEMLKATGRHPMRPAHIHFMISAPGHETLVTHVFADGDPYLDSDAVFGVKEALVRAFEQNPPGTAPDGRVMDTPWRSLTYDFALRPLAG
ncbi:intradiol ring-cleavage dioxygenase [Roseomonas sp. HF4]|uniref:intradiol ring-cleavage dioxygenase n=1 Tax=Roseomonas sp. HF4 TaxID=2562313 RepID=UPI0010C05CDF|nr:intradiol ring-cleavage dioxygenase [Roseomonas sp. HF4]